MPTTTLEIVTTRFNAMLHDLAAIDPTVEFKTVVTAVALRVVNGAADKTRAAKASGIKASFANKEWTTLDGKKYRLTWHDKDNVWAAISSKRNNNLKTRLAEIGLAKQSWLQVAAALGGSIDVPQYVRKANFHGGQFPQDGSMTEESGGQDYALTIINSSPIVRAAGGYGALLSSMAGEVGYFRQNMAHQFYLTAASRAAKYPGIFVSESTL